MEIPDGPRDWYFADATADIPVLANLVRAYCEPRPAAIAALVAGSWARGEARIGSDVDLYIITDVGNVILRDQKLISGWPVQINWISYSSAVAVIARGVETGNPFYVGGFANAKHLYGVRGVSDNLMSYAARMWARGPGPYTTAQREVIRLATVNSWLKLRRSSGAAIMLTAHRLFTLLLRYLQIRSGGWLFEEQWIEKHAQISPAILNRLSTALAAASLGDPLAMLALTVEILDDEFRWTTQDSVPFWPQD